MLTLVEAISLAGDRAKQNDDACGFAHGRAWVIDGATDLYSDPAMGAASDAAWIAHGMNAFLYANARPGRDLRDLLSEGAGALGAQFHAQVCEGLPAWRKPAASIMLTCETATGIEARDLGDSRLFALDAKGAAFAVGGRPSAAADETAQARAVTGGRTDTPPLARSDVIEHLRALHAHRNEPGGWWVFGTDPTCADHARLHALSLTRPAHVLIATDGFAALADRYERYNTAALVEAARDKGLQELGRELRAIETADAGGDLHPRFKRSDDATALLLRLE